MKRYFTRKQIIVYLSKESDESIEKIVKTAKKLREEPKTRILKFSKKEVNFRPLDHLILEEEECPEPKAEE